MGNAYLQARDADRQKYFKIGCDIATQQMFDMLCLVLSDPNVMGHDTFGVDRLNKVYKALYDTERAYHSAWVHNQESDYYQEKLDSALREIFKDELDPFSVRYPYTKEWDYRKAMK